MNKKALACSFTHEVYVLFYQAFPKQKNEKHALPKKNKIRKTNPKSPILISTACITGSF